MEQRTVRWKEAEDELHYRESKVAEAYYKERDRESLQCMYDEFMEIKETKKGGVRNEIRLGLGGEKRKAGGKEVVGWSGR